MFKSKLALCFVVTMAINLFPMGVSLASDTTENEVRADRRFYVEDFSEFTEDRSFTAIGDHRLGNVVITIAGEGDSVELTTDTETEIRGLKVTKSDNGSHISLRYIFPEEFDSGTIEASFKARIENHSMALVRWPMIGNSEGTVAKAVADGGLTWWYGSYGGENWGLNLNASSRTHFNTYQTSVDLTEGKFNLREILDTKSNKASAIKDSGSGAMSFLDLTIAPANVWDNTPAGTNEGDGIYWISGFSVGEESSTIHSVDFGDCELTGKTFTGKADGDSWYDLTNWSLCLAGEKDIISVETDTASDKPALKIVRDGTDDRTDGTEIQYKIPAISSGKIVITFTARFENHTRSLLAWPLLRQTGGSWPKYGQNVVSGTKYYFNQVQENEDIDDISHAKSESEYSKFVSVCTFDDEGENKYTSTVFSADGTTGGPNEITTTTASFDNIIFRVNNATYGGENDGEGAGVYWIGSLDVEKLALKITGASAKHNSEDVPVNRPLEVYFNHAIRDEDLTSANFKLYKGEEPLGEGDYSLAIDSTDDTKVYIIPNSNMDPETEYTLRVEPGIATYDAHEVPLQAGLTRKFTTGSAADDVDDFVLNNVLIEDSTETPGSIEVTATLANSTLSNDKSYFLVVASFEKTEQNGNEVLLDVFCHSSQLDVTGVYSLDTTLKKPAGQDGSVKFYIWDSLDGFNALSEVLVEDIIPPPLAD